MMITSKMEQAFNSQIQKEFHSAYLYLAMSVYCESQNYSGFAHWLKVQYHEEQEHAMKMVDYLLERGGKVNLQTLAAPSVEYGSPLQVFEKVLEHEQFITASIHSLYETAVAEKDLAAQIFLQWYVTEQVEEEANATQIVEQLKMLGDKSSGIMYIDKALKNRQ